MHVLIIDVVAQEAYLYLGVLAQCSRSRSLSCCEITVQPSLIPGSVPLTVPGSEDHMI